VSTLSPGQVQHEWRTAVVVMVAVAVVRPLRNDGVEARSLAVKPPGMALQASDEVGSASACSRVTPARRRHGPTGWLGWPRSAREVPPCVHDTLLQGAAQ